MISVRIRRNNFSVWRPDAKCVCDMLILLLAEKSLRMRNQEKLWNCVALMIPRQKAEIPLTDAKSKQRCTGFPPHMQFRQRCGFIHIFSANRSPMKRKKEGITNQI